jgi:hypothetical protein
MEDKKNIVIKVKYPASNNVSEPKVVMEWNIKRIVAAVGGVILIIVLLIYFIKDENQKTDLQPRTDLPAQAANTPPELKTGINKHIIRALLTLRIDNNEPVDELLLPLKLGKKKPVSVYYFVELAAMNGRTVYHEWLLNGELVTRKKVNISDDSWRTSSRQLFAYSARNNWTARLVDETGQLLNEIQFTVIYE